MSDPNFRDPRLDPAPLREEDIRAQRMSELNSNNAMWGWIAGALVLAVVLVFVFARGQGPTETASNVPSPPATTGSAPPRDMNPPAANTQVPRPQPTPSQPTPSTTGQGTAR